MRLDEFDYTESYDQITYDQEFNLLRQVVTQQNAALKYRRTSATVSNLINALAAGTKLLHIACHGEKGEHFMKKTGQQSDIQE